MKCVSKVLNGQLTMRKVKDHEAEELVDHQGWKYEAREKFRNWKKGATEEPKKG